MMLELLIYYLLNLTESLNHQSLKGVFDCEMCVYEVGVVNIIVQNIEYMGL